jgi:DNA-binding MarR family transcriptional regulator
MKQSAQTLSLFTEVGHIIRERMVRAAPLPLGQCELLRYVGEGKEPTMRDVSRRFHVTAPSATAQVDELVRLGFIKRIPDTNDRRIIHCILTKKGALMNERIARKRKAVLGSVLSALAQSDRADLDRILTNIIQNK